jgi:CBS domain-containing protein
VAQTVRELMTPNPVTCSGNDNLKDAARQMKERDIGAVMVLDGGKVRGMVTDRDIVVRGLAEGLDPSSTTLGQVCSSDLVSVRPDDTVDTAVRLMRDRALRRLPVMDGDKPVGILSLGDLAVERDPASALGQISGSPPNA